MTPSKTKVRNRNEKSSNLVVARAASAPADFFLNLLLLDRVLAGLSAAARAGILLTALSTRALVPLLAGSGVRHNV
jgi:hypothetical protein